MKMVLLLLILPSCLCVLFGPTRKFSSHLFPGRYHLIGSSEPIVAAPGDDVILPCRVDPDMDAVEKTVEWSKPDLEVDPSDRQKYVFLYRSQRENRHMMMAAYIERTSLSSEGLKHGDVSLRIRNVTLKDSGRFRCLIPTLRTDAEVRLVFYGFTADSTEIRKKCFMFLFSLKALSCNDHVYLLPCLLVITFMLVTCAPFLISLPAPGPRPIYTLPQLSFSARL
uniref:Ig-like domain-containing protein n=1 Tax=Kryptolebias marmoratus TaxID=37003 RepID=A0A3Q2ZID1_KRYMA